MLCHDMAAFLTHYNMQVRLVLFPVPQWQWKHLKCTSLHTLCYFAFELATYAECCYNNSCHSYSTDFLVVAIVIKVQKNHRLDTLIDILS